MGSALPAEVETYLSKVVERLVDCAGNQLVGVYLFGSASYDAYQPGLSDLDVQAVVTHPLTVDEKERIVSRLKHDTLACPATKLEFVLYAQDAVNPAQRHPRFELNLILDTMSTMLDLMQARNQAIGFSWILRWDVI